MSVSVTYTGKGGKQITVSVEDVDTEMSVSDFISDFCTTHNLPASDYYIVFCGDELPPESMLEECQICGSGEALTLYTRNIPA